MNTCGQKRQEKHSKHLGIDTFLNLFFRHAHLLHDVKPGLVLVPLCNLLIVHDQHCAEQEYNPQQNSQEKQTSVQGIKTLPLRCHAFHIHIGKSLFILERSHSLSEGTVYINLLAILAGQVKAIIIPAVIVRKHSRLRRQHLVYFRKVRKKYANRRDYLHGVRPIFHKFRNYLFYSKSSASIKGNLIVKKV